MIANNYGLQIDYEEALAKMDPTLRDELREKITPENDQEFFDAYAKLHLERFGEEWEPATRGSGNK